MVKLVKNTRAFVLLVSLLLSFIFGIYSYLVIPPGILQHIRFEQLCGLSSMIYLYISLLIGPLYYQFPNLPQEKNLKHMRRAIGVSAFYFAGLHTYVTFFIQLQGFSGLAFLTDGYILSLILGLVSLFILMLLTLTSFDVVIKKMGFANWKLLHRLTYVGGVLLLLHVMMVGTHFDEITSSIAQLMFIAVGFLFFLNAIRVDAFLKQKFALSYQFGFTTSLTLGGIISFVVFIMYSHLFVTDGQMPFSLHSSHMQLAKEVQTQNTPTNTSIPGLDGDRTLRYNVLLDVPNRIQPQEETTLTFSVFNASTGNPVEAFKTVSTKFAHLIIVDKSLQYFSHVHPEQVNNSFVITTAFPKSGEYHLYLDFQPYGGIEQQIGFMVTIAGDPDMSLESLQSNDTHTTKQAGSYTVSLDTHGELSASAMSLGQQTISFILSDTQSKKPITNMRPYLGSLGHLVMIRKEDYTYLHVHPSNLTTLPATTRGGPQVDFLPIGIYGAFKEGTYRVFAQFNPGDTLITADFTVKVGK